MNLEEFKEWKAKGDRPPGAFKARVAAIEDMKGVYTPKDYWQRIATDGGNVVWNRMPDIGSPIEQLTLHKNGGLKVGDIFWVTSDVCVNLWINGQKSPENHPDKIYEPIYYAGKKSDNTSRFQSW